MVRSLARFSQTLRVLSTAREPKGEACSTKLRRRGYSRDRRPDLPQMILAVAVDRKSWPVA